MSRQLVDFWRTVFFASQIQYRYTSKTRVTRRRVMTCTTGTESTVPSRVARLHICTGRERQPKQSPPKRRSFESKCGMCAPMRLIHTLYTYIYPDFRSEIRCTAPPYPSESIESVSANGAYS
jgi:hypothetical protein